MMTKNDDGLRARMAALLRTPVPVLRKRYAALGKDPAGVSKDDLVKTLTEQAEPAPAKAPRPRTAATPARDPRLPSPGTVLERTFKGKVHKVTVRADGLEYAGKTYRSLTAAAKVATGYASISGTLFFGISHRKGAEPKPATETPAPAKTAKAPRAPKSKRARGKK